MGDDQKRDETVKPTSKSAPQLIKQQKGFVKHALLRPSPSGKSKTTANKPGASAASHQKRENSPSALLVPKEEVTIKQETLNPPAAERTELKPGSRLFSVAMKDTARPQPSAAAVERGELAPSSHQERRDEDPKRKRKPHSQSESPARYSPDPNKSSKRYKKDGYYSSDYSKSPSPLSPVYRSHGRDSVEEGEVRDPPRKDRRDHRDRDGDRGDGYRRHSHERSPPRSRSRERRRHSKDKRRSRTDRYDDDDRGYDRRNRGRSREKRDRDKSYERKRSRSREERRRGERRDDQKGARGGSDRGRADYRQRERDYKEQERKKMYEGGHDEYRKTGGRGGELHADDLRGSGSGSGGVFGGNIGQYQQQPYYPQQQQHPVAMSNIHQPNYNYPPSMYTGQLPQQMSMRPPLPPPPPQTRPAQPPVALSLLHNAGLSMWPMDIATAGARPPSPDVSKYIEAITAAHNLELSPTDGIRNAEALTKKIYDAEKTFRRKESHIWAAQQAQQEMLLSALDGNVPSPFDAVIIENLKLPASVLSIPGSPLNYKASAMPLEPLNPAAPPPDPRSHFSDKYRAVKEWARRPLRVPSLRRKEKSLSGDGTGAGAGAPAKPSTSWSQSPSRDYGEPEVSTLKNKAKPAPPRPPSIFAFGRHRPGSAAAMATAAGGVDDVLNAPSAPRHDISFSRNSLLRSTQRTSSHYNLLTAGNAVGTPAAAAQGMGPMEIDEGFFMITLPNSTETRQQQYSQLLPLISQGIVPAGWPVYRDIDQLWVPLQHSTTSVEEFGSTRVKEAVIGVSDKASVVWNHAERKGKSKEWLDALNDEAVETSTGVGDEKSVFRTERYLVAGGEERQLPKKQQVGAEKEEDKVVSDDAAKRLLGQPYLEADASAKRSISEAVEKVKLKRKAATLPVSTFAAPAHVVAAVHGALLTNRFSIRQVAKSVLQASLRTVIEQKQEAAKKRLAEKNADKANGK